MSGMTDYLEANVLNGWVRAIAQTEPAGTYLGLFTTMPADDGTGGVEVSGGSYARVQSNAKFPAATAGSLTNNADIDFGTASASWGTILGVGLFDASSGGDLLWFGTLTLSKAVGNGDTFKISSGNLTITLD